MTDGQTDGQTNGQDDGQDVPPLSDTAAPADASGPAAPSEGDVADLWSSWIASPDDPAARGALVETVAGTVSAEVSDAPDDAAATAGSGDDVSDRIMREEVTYGSDDVVLEQIGALGAAENVSDGMATSDGTLDHDWT